MALKARSLAVDIWMKIDLADCAKKGCAYLHDSTLEAGDVCIADSEQKCPEARRRLWKLRDEIAEYYLNVSK